MLRDSQRRPEICRSAYCSFRLTAKLREGAMDSNFHFGPARSGEVTAYGARTPDASPTSIFEWADFMRAQGVTRVCCLLDAGQLAGFPVDLEAEYKRLFGPTRVLMEPIADHHLCSRRALRGNILPFLRTADTRRRTRGGPLLGRQWPNWSRARGLARCRARPVPKRSSRGGGSHWTTTAGGCSCRQRDLRRTDRAARELRT